MDNQCTVASATHVYLNSAVAFTVEDRLTLPAGFVPNQPPILSMERLSDETGVIATVLHA